MGVKLEIAGIEYQVEDYSVVEEATPISLSDTSQSTGYMSALVRMPEEFSKGRRLVVLSETNPVSSPIVTLDQVSRDPDTYSAYRSPEGTVIVERISEGSDLFYVGDPLWTPEDILIRFRGAGRAQTTRTPLPPHGPESYPPLGWFSIPSAWSHILPQDRESSYPLQGRLGLRLENVGDWIELSRQSPRSDTLTGDSPEYRNSTRTLVTSWRSARNESPSVSTWTYNQPSSDLVSQLGASLLIGQPYTLTDDRKGFTTGVVAEARMSPGGLLDISGVTDLDQLNSYNVVARPSNLSDYPGLSGTLSEVVHYYAALAGVPYVWVDPAVANRAVSYPGWTGETWFHLKQLASVHGCEISFVAGVPVFRPVRGRVTEPGRWTSKSVTLPQPDLAQSVEGYNQNIRDIRGEYVVHPDIGDGTVFSVRPGESETFTIDIPASIYRLSSVSAVFTREDGRGLTWDQARVDVEINPRNSRQIFVTMAPPATLNTERVYIGRIINDERVPGLYIQADGVSLDPRLVSYRTGVDPSRTGTTVGTTLDSPFLGDADSTRSALAQAAAMRAAPKPQLSGSVTNINRRGDSGIPDFVSYVDAQTLLDIAVAPGFTYDDLLSFTSTLERGDTYRALMSLLNTGTSQDYRFQEFGNVAGSRIWEPETRRWYRIRSATITPFEIQGIQAEDDLLLQEFVDPWESAGMTYDDIHNSLPVGGPDDSPFMQGFVKVSYEQLQLGGVPVVE